MHRNHKFLLLRVLEFYPFDCLYRVFLCGSRSSNGVVCDKCLLLCCDCMHVYGASDNCFKVIYYSKLRLFYKFTHVYKFSTFCHFSFTVETLVLCYNLFKPGWTLMYGFNLFDTDSYWPLKLIILSVILQRTCSHGHSLWQKG